MSERLHVRPIRVPSRDDPSRAGPLRHRTHAPDTRWHYADAHGRMQGHTSPRIPGLYGPGRHMQRRLGRGRARDQGAATSLGRPAASTCTDSLSPPPSLSLPPSLSVFVSVSVSLSLSVSVSLSLSLCLSLGLSLSLSLSIYLSVWWTRKYSPSPVKGEGSLYQGLWPAARTRPSQRTSRAGH
jgi:hypothetical protein